MAIEQFPKNPKEGATRPRPTPKTPAPAPYVNTPMERPTFTGDEPYVPQRWPKPDSNA